MNENTLLLAPYAWISGSWQKAVLLEAGPDGLWSRIVPGVSDPPPRAQRLSGPALPGLVNGHSHAFQRAFAGLTERREAEADDFWSWREQMYRVAQRIEPAHLQAIAAQLYIELLNVGYTHVCEFHYLHHRRDGSLFQDPLEMSWALALASAEAGVQLTLLPVLYERGGFDQPTLTQEQSRFRAGADQVWAMQSAITSRRPVGVRAGLALHSVRAVTPDSITRLLELAENFSGPIHIHVAEQAQEVDQCVATLGARPIEWLARHGKGLDARWQLVHATHASRDEIELVARSGAGIVLCPTTEANLGDGLPDLKAWLEARVPISIGSDSHITRSWREELRWLEYGQRLVRQQRNIAAAPELHLPSTAARLFECVLQGGAAAAGFAKWGLQVGARADLLVVDRSEASLLGVSSPMLLDAIVFSSPGRPWRDVMVAGRWQIKDYEHPLARQVAGRFEQAMVQLWREPSA